MSSYSACTQPCLPVCLSCGSLADTVTRRHPAPAMDGVELRRAAALISTLSRCKWNVGNAVRMSACQQADCTHCDSHLKMEVLQDVVHVILLPPLQVGLQTTRMPVGVRTFMPEQRAAATEAPTLQVRCKPGHSALLCHIPTPYCAYSKT